MVAGGFECLLGCLFLSGGKEFGRKTEAVRCGRRYSSDVRIKKAWHDGLAPLCCEVARLLGSHISFFPRF